MKRIAGLSYVLVMALLFISVALCSEQKQNSLSLNELGTGAYFQKMEDMRQAQIRSMIKVIVDRGTSPTTVKVGHPQWWAENQRRIAGIREAINILGLLRAKEAVPVLINNITLAAYEDPGELRELHEQYPSVGALISIGNPASEALLARLDDPTSIVLAHLYLYTLCQIETPEFARIKLQYRLKTTENPAEKKTLEKALNSPLLNSP